MKGLLIILLMGAFFQNERMDEAVVGSYYGSVSSYEIFIDDNPVVVAGSDVTIEIKDDNIIYSSEGMNVEGDYEIIEEGKKYYRIAANMGNGKSLSLKMYFKVHKKGKEIIMTAEDFETERGTLLPKN